MQEKEGFTGIRDLDAELLLKMDDREFIKTCTLNNYFIDLCKRDNYFIFKKKLQLFYPDTLDENIFEKYDRSWKTYYALVVKAVAELKEKYNYDYTGDNPFFQLKIFKKYDNYQEIFTSAISNEQLPLVAYTLKQNPSIIISSYDLQEAANLPDMKILKYLIAHGVDMNLIKDIKLFSRPSTVDYLKSVGFSKFY